MSDDRVPDDLSEGAPRQRPDHPDFWKLASIMLQMDAMAGESSGDLDTLISGMIDERSLAYMAFQRGLRGVLNEMDHAYGLAAIWVEGFVVGTQWQRDRQEAEK